MVSLGEGKRGEERRGEKRERILLRNAAHISRAEPSYRGSQRFPLSTEQQRKPKGPYMAGRRIPKALPLIKTHLRRLSRSFEPKAAAVRHGVNLILKIALKKKKLSENNSLNGKSQF